MQKNVLIIPVLCWQVGAQYEVENEEELKDKLDFTQHCDPAPQQGRGGGVGVVSLDTRLPALSLSLSLTLRPSLQSFPDQGLAAEYWSIGTSPRSFQLF